MTTAEETKAKLLAETARCPFSELQRFFAQGSLLRVETGVDLMDVGVALALDDTSTVQQWMTNGQVVLLEDAVAASWMNDDLELWTMVVRPWILVQPCEKP
jgi:hypothetical protein